MHSSTDDALLILQHVRPELPGTIATAPDDRREERVEGARRVILWESL